MAQLRHLLPQLYCFTLVMKHRSFTLAAEELNISQSSVSYQIRKLEEQLGYPLVIREPRKPLRLTSKGNILLQRCEQIYASLDNTLEEIDGSSLEGELNLTTDVCFGTLVIASALPYILKRYPKLQLNLHLSDEFVDLSNFEMDIAIRSRNDDSELEYEFLCQAEMMLVASKDYLAAYPPIKTFQDLEQHRVLCTGDDDFDWHNITTRVDELNWHKLSNRLRINNVQALTQAMIAGAGIAYLAPYTLAQQLEEGTLQPLLADQLPILNIPYYLTYPAHTKSYSSHVKDYPGQHTGNPKIQAIRERLQDFIRHSELGRFLQVNP